jgi:hypothetical protein
MRALRYLLGFALIIISFFGVTWFDSYKGELIPYPDLITLGFVVVGLLGFLLLYIGFKNTKSLLNNQVNSWKQRLKQNGEKIAVAFNDCEIKNNFYYDEVLRHTSEARSYNSIAGQDHLNTQREYRNASVVVYKYTNLRTGTTHTFSSEVIQKDKLTLSVLMEMKQNTFIYIDKANPDLYFFDMDFLDN